MGYFFGWFVGLVVPVQETFVLQKIFFLTIHYFYSFVPIAKQARQAAVLGHLTLRLCLCLWVYVPLNNIVKV
jgi:hypothetical protein